MIGCRELYSLPNIRLKNAATHVVRCGTTTTSLLQVMLHAKVVAHLMCHRCGHTHCITAMVLWGKSIEANK